MEVDVGNCSRSTCFLDLRSVGPRTPPFIPHSLSPTLPCSDLRTFPDHISSLLCPTTARRPLIGPGITAQGKYIIQHKSHSHAPARDIVPVHLTRHFFRSLRPSSNRYRRSLLLAISPERSKNTYQGHVNDLPLRDAPSSVTKPVRRPKGYGTKFTAFLSPLLYYHQPPLPSVSPKCCGCFYCAVQWRKAFQLCVRRRLPFGLVGSN
jgi:hypothetical protein